MYDFPLAISSLGHAKQNIQWLIILTLFLWITWLQIQFLEQLS